MIGYIRDYSIRVLLHCIDLNFASGLARCSDRRTDQRTSAGAKHHNHPKLNNNNTPMFTNTVPLCLAWKNGRFYFWTAYKNCSFFSTKKNEIHLVLLPSPPHTHKITTERVLY